MPRTTTAAPGPHQQSSMRPASAHPTPIGDLEPEAGYLLLHPLSHSGPRSTRAIQTWMMPDAVRPQCSQASGGAGLSAYTNRIGGGGRQAGNSLPDSPAQQPASWGSAYLGRNATLLGRCHHSRSLPPLTVCRSATLSCPPIITTEPITRRISRNVRSSRRNARR